MVVDEGNNVQHHLLPDIHLIEEPKGVDALLIENSLNIFSRFFHTFGISPLQ